MMGIQRRFQRVGETPKANPVPPALDGSSLSTAKIYSSVAELIEASKPETLALCELFEPDLEGLASVIEETSRVVVIGSPNLREAVAKLRPGDLAHYSSLTEFALGSGWRGKTLVYTGIINDRKVLRSLMKSVLTNPELEVCFARYVLWLAEGRTNASIRPINAFLNEQSGCQVSGYVMDPKGIPKLSIRGR